MAKRLRDARKFFHYSQEELADSMEIDKSTISHWERGRSLISANKLEIIAEKLGVTPEWLMFGIGQGPTKPTGFASPQAPSYAPPPPERRSFGEVGPKDLPVYGSAQGGFEGEEVDISFPIAHIPRPSQLVGARRAFGVYVVGGSMEPRYFAGEVVLCNPGKPIKKGDFVVVELVDHRALVKQFVSSNDTDVKLAQFNPPSDKKFPRQYVLGIHRIVGTWSDS